MIFPGPIRDLRTGLSAATGRFFIFLVPVVRCEGRTTMTVKRLGRRRWGWAAAALAVVPAFLLLAGSCEKTPKTDPPGPEPTAEAEGPAFFEEIDPQVSGLVHTYHNGQEAGHMAILESIGGGAVLIDYDGDGLLDVFLPGGGYFDRPDSAFPKRPNDKGKLVRDLDLFRRDPPGIKGHPCKLYKNLGNFRFKDVTKEAGLDGLSFYTHGGAVADYDRDGWPDLLVTGWGRLALLHNEPDGKGGRRFVDVTQKAGLNDTSWSTSAAWADFDGDGHVDLYVCHYGNWSFSNHPECSYDNKTPDVCPPKTFHPLPHLVYRNNGDGTFTDVSNAAGLRVPRKEEDYAPLKKALMDEALATHRLEPATRDRLTKEAFERLAEPARKGLPPGKRLDDAVEKDLREKAEREVKALDKEAFAREVARDVEKMAEDNCQRLRQAHDPGEKEPAYGKGQGVVAVDVNADGKPDVYVANDTVDNFLYINRSHPGHILFEEMGLGAGVARDDKGAPDGSMGVDAGDPLGTGRPTIWVTNYENEMHAFYINDCKDDRIIFRYGTQTVGIAAIGQAYVGWGTAFIDFDLDGLEDLFVSNGHAIEYPGPSNRAKRAQKPVLLHNQQVGARRLFKDVTRQGGPYCQKEHVGRGVAFGDLDNDGRVDMVLANLNEPTALLRNVAGAGNHWLGVELRRKDNRSPVGARVVLEAGGRTQTRFAKGGGSFLSANDPRHVFGLGQGTAIDRLKVIWPTGEVQTWEGLACDRYWRLVEGEKEAQDPKYARAAQ
jgi:hypothetical protein